MLTRTFKYLIKRINELTPQSKPTTHMQNQLNVKLFHFITHNCENVCLTPINFIQFSLGLIRNRTRTDGKRR